MVRKLALAFGFLLFAGTAFAYTPPQTCPAHNWFSAFDPIKPLTCTQPSFSDLLGTLGAGQFTATSCTNQVITALSNSGAGTCSTVGNAALAGPLVNGVTIGPGGDFTLTKSDPLAVGNETLTPGNVTVTHLSSPLPVAQGGTGASTLTAHGVLLGEGTSAVTPTGTQTAGQVLVGQGATLDPLWKSGSACAANQFVNSSLFSSAGVLPCAQPSFANLSGNPTATQLGITTSLLTGTGAGDYSTASTTPTAVDTTNLRKAVTIPTGSKLQIDATAEAWNSTAGGQVVLSVDDGGTQLIGQIVTSTGASQSESANLHWTITGDGASHTITLDFETSGAGTAFLRNNNAIVGTKIFPVMRLTLMPSN